VQKKKTYGSSAGYKSTVKMNFYGQDKPPNEKSLGGNPNDEPAYDEYIVNL